MSAYQIDFSDPLKNGFAISDGSFNGPGGSSANTSLRLYGRGAREWGEAVDEDLVRLTENFAAASAPSVPIAGQFWVESSLYYRDTSLGSVLQGWYFYDVNSVATNKWTLLGGTGVVSGTAPLSPVEGQYYYDGGVNQLQGYFSLGRYEPLTWVTRSSMSGTGAPVSPAVVPLQQLRVWNAGTSAWVSPSVTAVTGGTPPVGAVVGSLWFNTTTGNLLVWTGAQWQQLVGPAISGGTSAVSGILNMNTYKITNLGAPSVSTDAATKGYVDSVVGGVGGFLPLTGGSLAGPGNLSVGGTLNVAGLATLGSGYVNSTFYANVATFGSTATFNSGLTSVGTINITTGSLNVAAGGGSFNGTVNVNGYKIVNLATGTNANDAVNVAQMNAAIAAGGVGATTPVIYTSGTYKAGDICITGGKIYIAVGGGSGIAPGGNWKQIWPATYS
jgi:hypothetical protein